MTRVNVGINPLELCDQHLLAEYRELPRCFAARYSRPRDDRPTQFCLGPGHVLWCAGRCGSLRDRFLDLVAEMRYRGFVITHLNPPSGANDIHWSPEDVALARPLLQGRILCRLWSMIRTPSWTHRSAPAWVQTTPERTLA